MMKMFIQKPNTNSSWCSVAPLLYPSTKMITLNSYSDDDCEFGDVRLTRGESSLQERVEIYMDGVWGTVCATDYSWTQLNTEFMCRELGRQLNITIISELN